ncbi:MAG: translation elongation factor Ts [Candidatus Tritonobacter lacicola]|nr:translation elongation factor Ts [Candidatus Tritonobacter lacicola]
MRLRRRLVRKKGNDMGITAAQVKELRDKTNAGFMDCKTALKESGGDIQQAVDILRKKGMAIAEKKAGRRATEGVVASCIGEGGTAGVLIEVNCETDFVARNSHFKELAERLAGAIVAAGKPAERAEDLPPGCREWITEGVAKLGENIVFRRSVKFELDGPGLIASYIHLGSRVGVLVEVGCGSDEASGSEVFKELVKDITLQIASASPVYITREQVPPDVIEKEREIYKSQMEGKPEHVIEKIIEGKLGKFYREVCLLDQIFIRPPSDKTVAGLIETKEKEIARPIEVRRFARFQVGEEL